MDGVNVVTAKDHQWQRGGARIHLVIASLCVQREESVHVGVKVDGNRVGSAAGAQIL